MSDSTDEPSASSARDSPNPDVEEFEPTFARTLGRIGREAVQIAFFAAIHYGLKVLVASLHAEREWPLVVLLQITALYAVIGISVIGGIELLIDCWDAWQHLMHRVRKGRPRLCIITT